MLRFLSTTFLAAVVLFMWGAITLLLVPGHADVVRKVADETAVLNVLKQHAPEGGVFSVPVAHADYTATSPFAMVAYRPNGMGMSQGTVMLVSFGVSWLAAMLAGVLLPKHEPSYLKRVAFVGGLGVFATLVVHVSNWIWMGYSPGFTAMATFDLLVGWVLAGAVLARLAAPGRRSA